MKFFVASWFFPPATSSEGIVTYKLFRNSRHHYDVCCSSSSLWSYQHVLPLEAENIRTFPIETSEFSEWVAAAVEKFSELHKTEHYDAIMTRSMPVESIEVAKKIKEKYPDIPWVASIADPIGKSPYDIKAWVLENPQLTAPEKKDFQLALHTGTASWTEHESSEIRKMCALKEIEDTAIAKADAVIFPSDTLKSYVLDSRCRPRVLTVPHSFDPALYPESANFTFPAAAAGKTTLSFLGHSDSVRSLEPIVRAMNFLRLNHPESLEKLHVNFVGNVTETIRTLIYNYYLYDHISIQPSVDYLTSLAIMKESDWLLHIDADFKFLSDFGGSVYFAGKIADYLGTNTPILGLTGIGTPAYEIIRRAGGICVKQNQITEIALILADIAEGRITPEISEEYRRKFSAQTVAEKYDAEIEQACLAKERSFTRNIWPEVSAAETNSTNMTKLITICVPAYNVEAYLDRCLHSFVSCTQANKLEVIVVIDGSPDASETIARAYAEKYPHIVKVITKQNSGHGSTINAALKAATGTYFRVVDGDDWVDSRDFAALIQNIEKKQLFPDLISTNYKQVYISDGHTVNWEKNGGQKDYQIFHFAAEDFTNEYFTMASMMVKTEVLRKADFQLQEHTFYVDVEFILFPIPDIKTVMFTPEYVYRYAVGNADQSINPDNFVSRYDHHDRVIRRILSYYAEKIPVMGKGQENYMRAILKRVIESHFTLSLIWDADRERGFCRAKSFDEFLAATNPRLHIWAGEKWNYLTYCRNRDFDPQQIKIPALGLQTEIPSELQSAVKAAGEKLAKNKILEKIAFNPATRCAYRKLFMRD